MEGWLSRITTNAFLDDVRRKRRRPAVVMADPPDALLPAAPAADEVLAAATLPDRVQLALARLPEDFRAAVVLCDVVGESYEQIAESLGIPIGTVRSRIHRGRALLRDALGDDHGSVGDGDGDVE
jgi:RNA polymerase sigma-70 factor (ECF subfamily)